MELNINKDEAQLINCALTYVRPVSARSIG